MMIYKTHNLGQDAILFQSAKAETAYKWISFIVDSHNPIDIVNQACYRKLVEQHNLNDQKDFICSNTLLKFIILLCEHVVDAITLKLRESFGIALDGWTENLMHIVAIFAICTESNCLLAICKMVLEVRNDKSDTCGWKTSSFKIQKNWKLQIYC